MLCIGTSPIVPEPEKVKTNNIDALAYCENVLTVNVRRVHTGSVFTSD